MARIELRFAPREYTGIAPYTWVMERGDGWAEAGSARSLAEAVWSFFLKGPPLREGASDRRWIIDARGLAVMAFDPSHENPLRRATITSAVVQISPIAGGDPATLEAIEMLTLEREVICGTDLA